MQITLDLPDELVVRLDALVRKTPKPPNWPFKKRKLDKSKLTIAEQEVLAKFLEEQKQYHQQLEEAMKLPASSRSTLVAQLLARSFEPA